MSAILSADDLNDFISPGVACIKPVETLPLQKPKGLDVRSGANESARSQRLMFSFAEPLRSHRRGQAPRRAASACANNPDRLFGMLGMRDLCRGNLGIVAVPC